MEPSCVACEVEGELREQPTAVLVFTKAGPGVVHLDTRHGYPLTYVVEKLHRLDTVPRRPSHSIHANMRAERIVYSLQWYAAPHDLLCDWRTWPSALKVKEWLRLPVYVEQGIELH